MKTIFKRGDFHSFGVEERYFSAVANRSSVIYEALEEPLGKIKVFLSHKHEDVEDLKDIIGFFEKQYGVIAYIDSMDKDLPIQTCGETATRIKKIIKSCDKFILLATNMAIESTWCNWELGYGDAKKFKNHIAILPLNDQGMSDSGYKGHEYMSIYPSIAYYYGTERYKDGTVIRAGYYRRYIDDQGRHLIEPLDKWLHKK